MQQRFNFKARDLNFDVELANAINVGPLKTSNKGHIALASKNLPGKVQYRKPLHPSMDGNTVELSIEQNGICGKFNEISNNTKFY